MNTRLLILEMTRQFYEDCKYIAENNSTQPLDEDACNLYNTILKETQAVFPECDLLEKFREIPPRAVKFKDAVLMGGQVYRICQCLVDASDPARASVSEGAAGTPPPAGGQDSAQGVSAARPGDAPGGATPNPSGTRAPGMAGSGAGSPNRTPSRGATANNVRSSAPPPNASARSADTDRSRNDPNKTRHPGYLTESEYKVSFKDLE